MGYSPEIEITNKPVLAIHVSSFSNSDSSPLTGDALRVLAEGQVVTYPVTSEC